MKTFSTSEKSVLDKCEIGASFIYGGCKYTITISGKPKSSAGEPKTDVYIEAKSGSGSVKEFKISYKQPNADFFENKMGAVRAQQIFGDSWKKNVIDLTAKIKDRFLNKKLVYKKRGNRTDKGSITLGWKFEFVDKGNGELSSNVNLTREQKVEVLTGRKLIESKRNAKVNGKIIVNSGVADFILYGGNYKDLQSIIDALVPAEEYSGRVQIYLACKALNYRTFAKKWDGDRHLCVYVEWFEDKGKLDYKIVFDKPFVSGSAMAEKLINSMKALAISNTDDIMKCNITDWRIVNVNEEE